MPTFSAKLYVMSDKLKEMVDYLRKMGATVEVNENPSEEKISRIKEQIRINKIRFGKYYNS